METKTTYKTRHRDQLLSYLKTVPGQHVTVQDIQTYFKDKKTGIGTATIYRQLERMVEEGLVTKYTIDNNSPACFEYIEQETQCHKEACNHCKCEICGRLIHLHCTEIPEVHKHILEHHGFAVNSMRTVYYGICRDCQEGAAGSAGQEKE